MKAFAIEFFWNHGQIPATSKNIASPMAIEYLGMFGNTGGGTSGAVSSVNSKTGTVILTAGDVGAIDERTLNLALSDRVTDSFVLSKISDSQVFTYYYIDGALAQKANMVETSQALATKATVSQLNEVKGLAESNELKLSTKAEQSDLDQLSVAVSGKVSQAEYNALVQACALLASRDFVIEQINGLLGGVSIDFDKLKEIADRLQLDSDQFGVITNALSKRIRFDAQQTLTNAEQQQARDNINAEAKGVAAGLVAAITPASIGAATAAQGDKANTALQSGDVAPVALSGSFSDLVNKLSLFNLVYPAYSLGANLALSASDTLGQMLGKLQSQISANTSAIGTKADAANTLALINQKISSVLLGAVNGVATLGSDGKVPIAQLPATSGITWQNLTVASGMAISSNTTYPMQIGKDARGAVYVRGIFNSTSNSVISASMPLFNLPSDNKILIFDTTVMANIHSCVVTFPDRSNPSVVYTCIRSLNGVQHIGIATAIAALEKVYINEQVIGFLDWLFSLILLDGIRRES